MTRTQSFAPAAIPSLDDVERIARSAIARLPEVFRRQLDGVILKVDDFPSQEIMREMDLASPYDILGLYSGHSTMRSVEVSGALPDTIYLYRRPLIAYWAHYDETFEHLVSHVLIHEAGHHFGLSDEDMHAIEDAAE